MFSSRALHKRNSPKHKHLRNDVDTGLINLIHGAYRDTWSEASTAATVTPSCEVSDTQQFPQIHGFLAWLCQCPPRTPNPLTGSSTKMFSRGLSIFQPGRRNHKKWVLGLKGGCSNEPHGVLVTQHCKLRCNQNRAQHGFKVLSLDIS